MAEKSRDLLVFALAATMVAGGTALVTESPFGKGIYHVTDSLTNP